MPSIAEALSDRIIHLRYDRITEDTVYEIKRAVLDTLGCCFGGLSMDKGRLAAGLAKKLGGPPESTIIGTGDKVSAVNAVLANGESANAQDWSAGCAFHDVPIVVSSALAMAESLGLSGRDLLLAVAAGLEISGRIGRAGANAYTAIMEGPDRGNIHWDPVTGMTHATFGAATAAGKLLRLDRVKMANALGIAGFICPPQTFRKFNFTTPIKMTKYAPLGWVAHSGVTAALLAETGYTGDIDLFEGEYGFGRYTGAGQWRPDRILRGIENEKIPTLRLFYKVYPMGRILPGAIDNFVRIIKENALKPEDIERVEAKIHILGSFPCFTQNKLQTPDDYCFNAQYALSCAAFEIDPVHWHDEDFRQDQRVRAFMKKVNIVFHEREDGLAMIEDSQARPMWVEVQTGEGKIFRQESSHIIGSYRPMEYRMTDEMLKDKFRKNGLRILSTEKIDRIEKIVDNLEELENVSGLMEQVIPDKERFKV